jgi:outer membrane receptor for ferrienterochelin and colicins
MLRPRCCQPPGQKMARFSLWGRPTWTRTLLGALIFLLLFLGEAGRVAAASPAPKKLVDMSLEELMDIPIYGVSKYPQKLSEAPASVTVVTREDVKRYGYRTLADILRSVPGFFVTNDRNYEYLGIRGFNRPGDYNSRFLLLIDGHRLNDPIYQMALIGQDFPLDVDLIERVEVIRGPSFALYGSGAFLAVINVITRRGGEMRGGEVSLAGGSFLSHKGRLSYGNRWTNGLEMLVSGSYFNNPGPHGLFFPAFDGPATNNGIASNCDYESAYNFFSKISYQGFTLTSLYGSRSKGIPTGAFVTAFNDSRNRTVDASGFTELKYERTLPSDWGLLARLGFNLNTYDGYYRYFTEGRSGFNYQNRDVGRSQWLDGEVQVTKRFLERHMLIAGAEFEKYLNMNQQNYDTTPYQVFLDDHRQGNFWALYTQGEFVLHPTLHFYAGVRFDRYSTCGSAINPRAALVYQPLAATTFKLLYNEGFRAPSGMELYYQDGYLTAKANPDLRPEKIRAFELIWEQKLAKTLLFKTSGFYYRINDLISQVTDPQDGLAVYRNLMSVDAKGVEVELGGHWRFLDGRLSYSFQDVRNLKTEHLLSNCPQHLGKVNLMAPLFRDKLFGGIEVLFTSPRRTLTGRTVSAYGVTNLTLLSRNLWKGLEVSASVYNLFNQRYFDPGSLDHLSSGVRRIEQDGTTFRLKATLPF